MSLRKFHVVLWALLCAAPALAREAPVAGEPAWVASALDLLAASPNPGVRAGAALRLGALVPRDAGLRVRAPLERALFDAEPLVRRAAAEALADLGAAASVGRLGELLRIEREASVLPALLLAIGRLAGPEGEALVLPHAHARPAAQRAAAVLALALLRAPSARAKALALFEAAAGVDENWEMRTTVLLALSRVGEPADLSRVRPAYRSSGQHHWLARSAYAGLVAHLEPQPLPELRALLADPDERVAVAAALAWVSAGHMAQLRPYLRDERASVRGAVAAALARVGSEQDLRLLRHVALRDPSRRVRWAAVTLLFERGDALGEQGVLEALLARDPALWTQALALLAARTGEDHGRDPEPWREALERHPARGPAGLRGLAGGR